MSTATIYRSFQYLGLLVAMVFSPFTTSAQISYTADDVGALIGKSYTVTSFSTDNTTGLQAIIDAEGANQTWDFTALSSFQEEYSGSISYMEMPADVPGADLDAFSGANMVMEVSFAAEEAQTDSMTWSYHHLTDEEITHHGMFYVSQTDVNGDGQTPDSLSMVYDPPQLESTFPKTYETTWSDESQMTMMLGDFEMTQEESYEAEVDGYGTLKLPGYTVDALRVDRQTTVSLMGFGATTTRTLDFVTNSGAFVTASIEFDPQGNPVGASYTVRDTETAIDQPGGERPRGYALDQNYPNPFNPSTMIGYELKETSNVELSVYNATGQKVVTLVNERQGAGHHQAMFRADDMPSGVYFYKLQAGAFSATKKMLLIK